MHPIDYYSRIGLRHLRSASKRRSRASKDIDAWNLLRAKDALLVSGPKDRQSVTLCGVRLTWPYHLPLLVTWSGQTTLATILRERLRAIREADYHCPPDLLMATHPITGSSGLDSRYSLDAIDVGFSLHAAGMEHHAYCVAEVLMCLGIQLARTVISLSADKHPSLGFVHDGRLHRFGLTARDGRYLWRLTEAQPDGEAPGERSANEQ